MPYFYRTENGAEIDLVFEALQPRTAYLLHSGTEEWPVRHGVTAISLKGLMKRLSETA